MSTVAEQLVDVPREAGVTRVSGVFGDRLNPFVDAIGAQLAYPGR